MRMQGQKAIVTGAGGAIRAAIIERLTGEGAEVRGVDGVDELAGAFETFRAGGTPATILVTVADARGADGPLAVSRRAGEIAEEAMCEAGGAIVHVGLPMGSERGIGRVSFAMLAGGLKGLVRAQAVGLGALGVTVNLVQPGAFPVADDVLVGMIPLQRSGRANGERFLEADDVAATVAFLASREATYVSGAEFVVDGGLSQCRDSTVGRAYDRSGGDWYANV